MEHNLRDICERLISSAAELNALDAKLGDGDLGTTVTSICNTLRDEIDQLPDDIGGCFAHIVSVISKTSGSSFSAVTMTGLLCAARAAKGRESLPWQDLPAVLRDCIETMCERGGAAKGDKSMIDGLLAITDRLASQPETELFKEAAELAISEALDDFREKPFRIGRARLAPNRGVGYDDPGMVALARIVGVTGSTQKGKPI